MPVYALYALYAYAGGHAAHDLYRLSRWAINKFSDGDDFYPEDGVVRTRATDDEEAPATA